MCSVVRETPITTRRIWKNVATSESMRDRHIRGMTNSLAGHHWAVPWIYLFAGACLCPQTSQEKERSCFSLQRHTWTRLPGAAAQNVILREQEKGVPGPGGSSCHLPVSGIHPYPLNHVPHTDGPSPGGDVLAEDSPRETPAGWPWACLSQLHPSPCPCNSLCERGCPSPPQAVFQGFCDSWLLGFAQREVLIWVWRVGLAWVKQGKRSPFLFALLAPTGEPRGPHPVGWPGPALCYPTSSLCPSSWGAVATAGSVASFQSPVCALPSPCDCFPHYKPSVLNAKAIS